MNKYPYFFISTEEAKQLIESGYAAGKLNDAEKLWKIISAIDFIFLRNRTVDRLIPVVDAAKAYRKNQNADTWNVLIHLLDTLEGE